MSTAAEDDGENTVKIVMAGDWHGNGRWARTAVASAADAGAEAIIHVGDLGAFWGEDWIRGVPDIGVGGFTGVLADAVAQAGIPFYFVDGNHDDHENLALLPRREDGLAEAHGLTYLPRGSRLELGGRTFGALGGAFSIDRAHRTRGVDWWPQEEITLGDVARLGDAPLDVLVAHEVPYRVPMSSTMKLHPALVAQSAQSRIAVQHAVDATEPALVFSGHWHQRHAARIPGTTATVHVLDLEGTPGNTVMLDTHTLAVTPMPVPAATASAAAR